MYEYILKPFNLTHNKVIKNLKLMNNEHSITFSEQVQLHNNLIKKKYKRLIVIYFVNMNSKGTNNDRHQKSISLINIFGYNRFIFYRVGMDASILPQVVFSVAVTKDNIKLYVIYVSNKNNQV